MNPQQELDELKRKYQEAIDTLNLLADLESNDVSIFNSIAQAKLIDLGERIA